MALFDFIGDAFNKDARDRASRAQHDAISIFGDVDPTIQGQTSQDAYQHLDPAGQDAQKAALGQLQQEYQMGGMDPQSKAALDQAQAQTAQVAKSNTDAALERASQEGRLNSGRALSAQMQANQAGANANALAGTQAAADAATRRNQAISGAAQVGGNLTGQAQQTAQGQNQAGQFNAGQLQTAQQQTAQNSLNRAQGIAAGDQALAGTNLQRAQEARESAGSVGDALMKGASMAAMSDKRIKQDIEPTGETIEGVPEKTFAYKGDPAGQTYKGVIAQDVERVRPEDVVKDEKGIRHVIKEKDKPKPMGKAGRDAFIEQLLGGR
jgi:hypothetical protein